MSYNKGATPQGSSFTGGTVSSKIKSIRDRFWSTMRRPKVYVEIDVSHILLGVLRQKGDGLHCEVFDQQSFCSLEVRKCGIYNVSAIYMFVKQVLDKHKLFGCQAIVSCPYFEGCSDEKKKMATFQVALCVCKAGLKIESLYEERLFFR